MADPDLETGQVASSAVCSCRTLSVHSAVWHRPLPRIPLPTAV